MPHDPEKISEVREWLSKAAVDLRAAEHDRQAEPPITTEMVFHAQQLAEKSLKAFLVWHDQLFRKTHNLVELGEACCAVEADLEPLLRRAALLTEYAWKFRYPGEEEDPSLEEADQALALAREVHQTILGRLPKEAKP